MSNAKVVVTFQFRKPFGLRSPPESHQAQAAEACVARTYLTQSKFTCYIVTQGAHILVDEIKTLVQG